MPNKRSSKSSPTITPEQAKVAVIRYYQGLKLEWDLALECGVTNATYLSVLRHEINYLERRAPWLKKEVAHEAC